MFKKIKYEIFADECKGGNNTIWIYTLLYGEEPSMKELKSSLDQKFETYGYNCTREFKSSNVTSISLICAREILILLKKHYTNGSIGFLIFFMSNNKLMNNVGFLEKTYKDLITSNPNDRCHYTKLGITESDALVLIKRATHFFPFLYFRDIFGFGDTQALYHYYPDATGKVLNFEDQTLTASGLSGKKVTLSYYKMMKVICNATVNLLRDNPPPGWTKSPIMLSEFHPIDSKSDSRIQVCDIISNYFYNYIKCNVGLANDSSQQRANIFNEIFDIDCHIDEISRNFCVDNDDIQFNKTDDAYSLVFPYK